MIKEDGSYSTKAIQFVDECFDNPRENSKGDIDGAWVSLVKLKADMYMRMDGLNPDDDMGSVNII